MQNVTWTLDLLDKVRGLADLAFLPVATPERLWAIEKYLVWRLERVGAAVPTAWDIDQEPGRDPTDEYDYLAELYDIGEAGC